MLSYKFYNKPIHGNGFQYMDAGMCRLAHAGSYMSVTMRKKEIEHVISVVIESI